MEEGEGQYKWEEKEKDGGSRKQLIPKEIALRELNRPLGKTAEEEGDSDGLEEFLVRRRERKFQAEVEAMQRVIAERYRENQEVLARAPWGRWSKRRGEWMDELVTTEEEPED